MSMLEQISINCICINIKCLSTNLRVIIRNIRKNSFRDSLKKLYLLLQFLENFLFIANVAP
jgi:hypothetical protein